MTSTEIQRNYLKLINSTYLGNYYFFTDGSVINERAGFTVYSNCTIITNRIPEYYSIYRSEFHAIKTCIENIINFDRKILNIRQ